MTESGTNILYLLTIGGVFSTILTVVFHSLSQRRQYRQALDQRMIDRISYLVEHYYSQVMSSIEALRRALIAAVEKRSNYYRENSFYCLLVYFHHINRLTCERPKPLLAEIEKEKKYVGHIKKINETLPFDQFDISFILSYGRTKDGKGIIPAHTFRDLITGSGKLKPQYDSFCNWIDSCNCEEDGPVDPNCKVHQVIIGCRSVCQVLEEQIQKIYKLWYQRRRKKPKIPFEKRLKLRLQKIGLFKDDES